MRNTLKMILSVLLLTASPGCLEREPNAPTPVVREVVPAEAAAGDVIRLNGGPFEDEPGSSTVVIGEVDATSGVAEWADDHIDVEIPDLAVGEVEIVIRVRGVKSDPVALTILAAPLPIIRDVTPPNGEPATEVQITGSNFSEEQGVGSSVIFAPGVEAEVRAWTDESITAVVPEGAESGDLFVRTAGGDSAPFAFTVGAGVSFSVLEAEIFVPRCALAGCHDGATRKAMQDLSAGQAYANLVSVPSFQVPAMVRVSRGSLDDSYLWIKLTSPTPPIGARMPLDRDPLSAADLARIESWILAGAPND